MISLYGKEKRNFINNVHRIMNDNKIAKSEFAELCGLSTSTLQNFDNNTYVKRVTAEKIADGLGVSISDLVRPVKNDNHEKTIKVKTETTDFGIFTEAMIREVSQSGLWYDVANHVVSLIKILKDKGIDVFEMMQEVSHE